MTSEKESPRPYRVTRSHFLLLFSLRLMPSLAGNH